MKLRSPSLLLLVLTVTGTLPLRAESDSAVATATSNDYPQVTCTSSNAIACADILQVASDTRQQLSSLLQLDSTWRFPVHIQIVMPDETLYSQFHQEGVRAVADGGALRLEAVMPGNDPNAREFVQRQFVTALLWEKFFAKGRKFDTDTRLDIVPAWLIEGLREWLNDDPEHDRASIVRRSTQIQHAPSLEEITSWHDLSDDRLLGLWQRAFCYYLVNSLIREDAKRRNFQEWLATLSGPNPSSAKYLFPTETGWQRELIDATQRSRSIVYTWDETLAELNGAQTISVPSEKSDKTGDTRLCTLDNVATMPRTPRLLAELQFKLLDLTNLELRAHPSWRSTVALYRFGLSAIVNGQKPEVAAKYLANARQQRIAEVAHHQALVDYMNWFEVTKNYSSEASYFRSYFITAQEMVKVQADPDHPNPIRAGVLQVESRL